MNVRFDSMRSWVSKNRARTLLVALAALSAQAAAYAATEDAPEGEKKICATRPPSAMLDEGAQPARHSFQSFPENHTREASTFSDGTQLDIDISGCQGPVTTELTFVLPKGPADKKKSVAALVKFLDVSSDALAKTPLADPRAAKALHAIGEGRMGYSAGDRICLDKDAATVVSEAQRCLRFFSLTWERGPKKGITFHVRHQAEP